MPSIKEWTAQATAVLSAQSPSSRLDAELLAMHVTGLTRAQLITQESQTLTSAQTETLVALLARRATGEPVAYLTGHSEFWSLPLTVTPATLIPRPETELLVEQALARIAPDTPLTIADLGTGSGAIALALAKERPACRLIGIDASADALAVARANQETLGIPNVEWRQGDWCGALREDMDMLVSNPPYVASGDNHLLGDGVRFEPRTALQAGPDGLDAIRRIAFGARRCLRSGGWLLLEHGRDQRAAVAALLQRYGCGEIAHYRDYADNDRVSVARWRQ